MVYLQHDLVIMRFSGFTTLIRIVSEVIFNVCLLLGGLAVNEHAASRKQNTTEPLFMQTFINRALYHSFSRSRSKDSATDVSLDTLLYFQHFVCVNVYVTKFNFSQTET